jgi:hypothetical protein
MMKIKKVALVAGHGAWANATISVSLIGGQGSFYYAPYGY